VHVAQDVDITGEPEFNAIAGLLKLYLRELPEPLLTYNLFDDFIAGGKSSHAPLLLFPLTAHRVQRG
jgi:hypothetical protein